VNGIFLLVVTGLVATIAGIVWYGLRRLKARQAAEEERLAAFMAATTGKPKPAETVQPAAAAAAASVGAGNGLAQQKLLFEAAHKAGEAGEPALAIQLYARLLARYPESGIAAQARTAAEAEKKKLAKA